MWIVSAFAALLLLVTAAPHPVQAAPAPQPPTTGGGEAALPQVRVSLLRLQSLLETIASEIPAVTQARDRARGVLRSLLELSVAWPAESPVPYRRNLARMVVAVERGLSDASTLPRLLAGLADDLETKLVHCRASGGKLGGSVRVEVRTVHGRQEAGQWQVLYLPKMLEASADATPDLFPQLSSPTQELLVPGRYVMWARDPFRIRVGDRVVLRVGDGRAHLPVELPVPPP